MKHTLGPWSYKGPSQPHNSKQPVIDSGGDYAIITKDTVIIAEAFRQTDFDTFQDAEANARLIAAAPEMLEALKKAKETIRAWNGMGHDEKSERFLWDAYQKSPEMKIINDAIEKAEGKQ